MDEDNIDVTVEEPEEKTSNVQKRMDELTAKFHEAERRAVEKDAQLAQAQQLLTRMLAGEVKPEKQVDPLEGIEDSSRVVLEKYGNHITSPLEEKIRRLEQKIAYQEQRTSLREKALPEDDEEIVKNAEKYLSVMRKNTPDIGTEDDALDLARGRAMRLQREKGQAPQRSITKQRAPADFSGFGRRAPLDDDGGGLKEPPAGFDEWSNEAQHAWFVKHGYDKAPF